MPFLDTPWFCSNIGFWVSLIRLNFFLKELGFKIENDKVYFFKYLSN